MLMKMVNQNTELCKSKSKKQISTLEVNSQEIQYSNSVSKSELTFKISPKIKFLRK